MAYKIGFVMEQTLGHVTHAENFRYWIGKDPDVQPTWIPIARDAPIPFGQVVPSNWTVRASLKAWTEVQAALRTERLDGLFFHTQVTALFAHRLMTKIPTVVSMDATPLNFDSIGIPYHHAPSRYPQVEAVKNALNRRTFNRARKLTTWHEWGKRSLVRDYGMNADKVTVIPPGIDMERWSFPRPEVGAGGAVRLLFVGGEFQRKGGEVLLTAFQRELAGICELDIVTREHVDTRGLRNVRVHHGLGPNAPGMMSLYAQADIFVFPTFADVIPIAIMEGMASGLPVVTTTVGAITEEVEHGVTGFLVPPNDDAALAAATLQLAQNVGLRRQMGAAGRRSADRLFNGATNYRKLLTVCKNSVDGV
jgi:glycosyltransferase involved in cell wall biosynthesis